jgi:hypothetical protein
MDDQHAAAWSGVMLRRPAVDPDIPRRDRALLTDPGTLLTPACGDRPVRTRDFLPMDPDKRATTVDAAVMGMTAAGFIAVGGATPLAIGVLVFQGAVGWQSASGRYALLLAEIVAVVTAVVFGTRIARHGQLNGKAPASVAARTHHGRYLTSADFDARSRALLRRAQDAVDAVTSSGVYQAGLLDESAVSASLADQEWDIALALREQTWLRARRAELSQVNAGAATAALLDRQFRAARLADTSVASRVAALERYAAEVRQADAAYRDWQQAAALAELNGQHLDMLARTAADEYGIADIEAMSQQARAIRLALRGQLLPLRRPGRRPVRHCRS